MIRSLTLAIAMLPGLAFAADLDITKPMVPMAPPGTMAHAAFLTLENTGIDPVSVIGASAKGYAMAHIHQSHEMNGVAMMHAVDQVELAPGQTVEFAHGGLHIMLMKPAAPQAMGDIVSIELVLSDGSRVPFDAPVMHMDHGS